MIIDLDTKNTINPRHIEELWHEPGTGGYFYLKAGLSSGKVVKIEGPFNNTNDADERIKQIARVW